jgi:carboxymethylenebutenolidase
VIVIHENRGLNPHIKDVTRRLATDGFVALGVDYLSPMGGTPADEDKAREMIGQLKRPTRWPRRAPPWPPSRAIPTGRGKVGAWASAGAAARSTRSR